VGKDASTALRKYKKDHGKKESLNKERIISERRISVGLKNTPPKKFKSEHNSSKSERVHYISQVMRNVEIHRDHFKRSALQKITNYYL
jgi:hypothetical protein